MAKAFPKSTFTGVEISTHAIERARANIEEWDLSNVSIQDAREQPLANDHSFDFVTTFDVVHDTPFPDRLISEIYSALRPDGTWLCSDIRSFPRFADNLAENPGAPLLYGFSVMVCMSSAMSEPGGAGLGTLGFNSEVAQEMTAAAGFTRVFASLNTKTPSTVTMRSSLRFAARFHSELKEQARLVWTRFLSTS